MNICGVAPIKALDGEYNGTYPQGSGGFIGVLAWKRGSLLVSLVWTAMVVMVLDRKWVTATVWALVGAFFAVFGIIHVPQAGFQNFASPTWEQCPKLDEVTLTPECWDHAEQWMFFVAYLMLAAFFALIQIARRFDKDMQEELDDPSAHAFDDWFKDAGKGGETDSDDKEDMEVGFSKEQMMDADDEEPKAVPLDKDDE